MSVLVLRGDARALPLPDASVDLICTSPPYFALRSYTDGGEHYESQIGSEPTPAEYISNLIDCTREWVRVLKPSGSLWVNLGDKYNAYNGGRGEGTIQRNEIRQTVERGNGLDVKGIRAKSLLGLPWRYALRCIDDLRLILRAEVIWSKPNGLPESATDRVRRSHEQWFHLVRQPRYFSAVDEIREATHRIGLTWAERKATCARTHAPDNGHMSGGPGMAANPLGKLPGSVWEIPTEPLQVPDHLGVDHFAAFPTELPRRIILGWSPSGICIACGEGRRPVTTVSDSRRTQNRVATKRHELMGLAIADVLKSRVITGEACACPDTSAPTRPAVVVDPFGGTGTTALVAAALGRHGISVDRSADYCRLAQWRTSDRGEIAKAMRVEKPPKQLDGQEILDLFA